MVVRHANLSNVINNFAKFMIFKNMILNKKHLYFQIYTLILCCLDFIMLIIFFYKKPKPKLEILSSTSRTWSLIKLQIINKWGKKKRMKQALNALSKANLISGFYYYYYFDIIYLTAFYFLSLIIIWHKIKNLRSLIISTTLYFMHNIILCTCEHECTWVSASLPLLKLTSLNSFLD